jgi:hypothetical protein
LFLEHSITSLFDPFNWSTLQLDKLLDHFGINA